MCSLDTKSTSRFSGSHIKFGESNISASVSSSGIAHIQFDFIRVKRKWICLRNITQVMSSINSLQVNTTKFIFVNWSTSRICSRLRSSSDGSTNGVSSNLSIGNDFITNLQVTCISCSNSNIFKCCK